MTSFKPLLLPSLVSGFLSISFKIFKMNNSYSEDEVFLGSTHLDIVFLFLGISWEDWILILYHLSKLKLIVINKRWSSHGYLIGENSESPPINSYTMTLSLNYLRC
jgi:hypothetical protein